MNKAYGIFTDYIDNKSSAELTVGRLEDLRNSTKIPEFGSIKISDTEMLKKIILRTDSEQDRK